MKKTTLIIIAILFQFTYILAQEAALDCVYCDGSPTGLYASIIGKNSTAAGVGSVAIGTNSYTYSTATNSIAIGTQVKVLAGLSIVMGNGESASRPLINNLNRTLMIGFGSTQPTFFVGRSPAYNKTGRIGIGNVTNPLYKLHVKADAGEQAAVFIEPNTWGEKASATLYLGTGQHSIAASYEYGMFFNSPKNYIFLNGNVGIGNSDPIAELDIEGNIRVGAFAKIPGQQKMIFADEQGILYTDNIPLINDNMGDCVAEYDIKTNGHWIKHDEEGVDKGIYISRENLIGIGTSMPRAALDVVSAGETQIIAYSKLEKEAGFWAANRLFSYGFSVDEEATGHITANINNPVNMMNFHSNGKISIGDAQPLNGSSHRLFVEGGITSEEVVINTLNANRQWPDYVFKKEYELMPLYDLKEYINDNGHLPNVPTTEEVSNNGQNIGELNAVLLEKIEELTLYIIKQQEEIDNLKQKINE